MQATTTPRVQHDFIGTCPQRSVRFAGDPFVIGFEWVRRMGEEMKR
jgi:hypothetical protein